MNDINSIKPEVSLDSLIKSKTDALSNINTSDSKQNLTPAQKQEFAKAARGFESIFVNMMNKQLKEAMLDKDSEKEDDSMSFGDDIMGGYTDMLFADQISKTGTGIGLADMIYAKLTGGEKLQSITSITPEKPILAKPENKPVIKPVQHNPVQASTAPVTNNQPVSGNFVTRVNGRLDNYDKIIEGASAKFNVPVHLIKAVITAESAGKPNAVSSVGAKGLMQLMDSTAKDLGVRNSFDPKENIYGGTKYLGQMLEKFGHNVDLAVAAYNAGPGNVQKHNGIPPFTETKNYVQRVKKYSKIFQNGADL